MKKVDMDSQWIVYSTTLLIIMTVGIIAIPGWFKSLTDPDKLYVIITSLLGILFGIAAGPIVFFWLIPSYRKRIVLLIAISFGIAYSLMLYYLLNYPIAITFATSYLFSFSFNHIKNNVWYD